MTAGDQETYLKLVEEYRCNTVAVSLCHCWVTAGDQEAYLKLVEESKNERLKTLLEKTDDLLERLGAMVQQQKDLGKDVPASLDGDTDGAPKAEEEVKGGPKEPALTKGASPAKGGKKEGAQEGAVGAEKEGEEGRKKRDLLEGQRRYDAAVHSIEEKVTEQPSSLVGGQLREYQLEGLQWMVSLYNNNLNGILADEMGLVSILQTHRTDYPQQDF